MSVTNEPCMYSLRNKRSFAALNLAHWLLTATWQDKETARAETL